MWHRLKACVHWVGPQSSPFFSLESGHPQCRQGSQWHRLEYILHHLKYKANATWVGTRLKKGVFSLLAKHSPLWARKFHNRNGDAAFLHRGSCLELKNCSYLSSFTTYKILSIIYKSGKDGTRRNFIKYPQVKTFILQPSPPPKLIQS